MCVFIPHIWWPFQLHVKTWGSIYIGWFLSDCLHSLLKLRPSSFLHEYIPPFLCMEIPALYIFITMILGAIPHSFAISVSTLTEATSWRIFLLCINVVLVPPFFRLLETQIFHLEKRQTASQVVTSSYLTA